MKTQNLLGLLFCLVTQMVSAETITIGAEDDWYPYAGTVDTKPKGMAVDIVTEAFKRGGVDVKLQSMPYGRCMEDAKAGKIFGCFDAARNSALENNYLWHAKPLFIARVNIYARADSSEKGLTSKALEGKTVAATEDYEYGEVFDTNTKIKRNLSKHDVQGFRKVMTGKADYMVAFEKVANHVLKQNKAEMGDKFKVVGTVSEVGLYMAVGKTSPGAEKYIERFNQGFDAIMKDGKYKAIEKAWE